ncbi:fidgetin-like protein 1 [Gigantopelta aegis]|uniref:fidgetin-like protein 1 n=1 Tax=Gigantopelta aegis TaxID=1735272 RepID=UPI001B88969F|nr:fidgetin-like protein 1 [Gigantopelta aegis]
MELNCQQSQFLQHLQDLHFSSDAEMISVSQKADGVRSMMVHLSSAHSYNIVPCDCDVSKSCRDFYETLADSLDSEKGFNNYAEGALAICRRHRNDSQKWQPSLTLESILNMACVTEMITNQEKDSRQSLPPENEDDSVFKNENAKHVKTLDGTDIKKNSSNHNLNKVSGDNSSNMFLPQRIQGGDISGNVFSHEDAKRRSLFSNTGSSSGQGHGNFGSCSAEQRVFNRPVEAQISKRHCDTDDPSNIASAFKTAKEQLVLEQNKKYGNARGQVSNSLHGSLKKSLGTRRGPVGKFVPPSSSREDEDDVSRSGSYGAGGSKTGKEEEPVDERLKGIDPKMVDLINNEIMDHGPQVSWNDIAGLEFAKKTIKEIVVWPMLRPDIFVGLRGPPKGLLLFGPPGTGKTLIGKCIASQSKSTFFCISASTLTSKWVGEGEKMVRALFAVARCNQPAVLFIDEIDSLLSQRSDGEHEASRRIKTEFLVQLDGASTDSEENILVIGATNRPQEIDEAARRRFIKRLYIPLPECAARRHIIKNLMTTQKNNLSDSQLDEIAKKTEGYSGSDMANLCKEAALGPIRSIPFDEIETISAEQVRCIMFADFEEAFLQVRASVSPNDLCRYIEWNNLYGSFGK